MSRPSTSTLRLIAATLAIFAAMPMAGRAATFAVDPIAVTLPKGNSSASVAVTNQSTQPLRLQVSGFAWDQKPDGEMDLTATDALVFFPQLLTLAAGETKRVRIGVTTAQGPSEKAYRVFMEELPSLQSVVAPERASVTIRMKVGIPVFVSSGPTATVNGAIRNADARGGALSFDVLNTGNTHFTIQTVHVDGKNAAGASVLSQNVTGWYLLPGNTRHFSVPLPADRCSDLRTLAVKVQANTVAFANTIADLTKQCDAGGAR